MTIATQTHQFDACLFDFDGTIVDSTPMVVKYWEVLCEGTAYKAEDLLKTSHGKRTIDVLQEIAPERANWEYVKQCEGRMARECGDKIAFIPGATALLGALGAAHAPWAIVTSGSRALLDGWLRYVTVPTPQYRVTANDITHGKPHPEPYLKGRDGLASLELLPRADSADIVVFEDAPSGIRAGKAAGFRVVGLLTSHSIDAVRAAGPDWIVPNLESIVFKGRTEGESGKVELEIKNAL